MNPLTTNMSDEEMRSKERPILFSGAMVKAILAGTKTQTRRIVNPQPPEHIDRLHGGQLRKRFPYELTDDDGHICGYGFQDDNNRFWKCKQGAIGDRLWVKETWGVVNSLDSVKPSDMAKDVPIIYRASSMHPEAKHQLWRPSLFMMRWASRITLEITNVRVERLQDISEEDAWAEGVTLGKVETGIVCESTHIKEFVDESPSEAYQRLWESINGKGSWDKNPWVWAITFKVITPTEGAKDEC